jgi:FtsP/CotA-like multicopper oxidase with cupredoxin domain
LPGRYPPSPGSSPFTVLNENVINFMVDSATTERWVLHNEDHEFLETHPIHVHQSSGYGVMDAEETSKVNRTPELQGTQDTYSVKAGTSVAVDIAWPFVHSEAPGIGHEDFIPHLSFMVHCHYMPHHDLMMMTQFYIRSRNHHHVRV